MSGSISRRDALKQLSLVAGACAGLSAVESAQAAELPHVQPDDATAAALAYTDDAKKVDPKKFPTYMPGQQCSTCLQLQGNAADPWRPCNLFPGKLVNANGWCRVWIKKA
jgi:hypothetical protein